MVLNTFCEKLQITVNQANDYQAEVCLHLPDDWPAERVSAQIRGPFCVYSRTLPVSLLFTHHTASSQRVTILDPCYWRPESPFVYRIRLENSQTDQSGPSAAATAAPGQVYELEWALRNLHRIRDSWFLNGRRFVMRAVSCELAPKNDFHDWHEQRLAVIVANWDWDQVCQAQQHGVPIVVDLREYGGSLNELCQHALRWSMASAVIVDDDDAAGVLRAAGSNLLLIQPLSRFADQQPSGWADGVLVSYDQLAAVSAPEWSRSIPVVASRPLAEPVGVVEARAACERLQRDLAPRYSLAGYFVGFAP